MLRTLMVWRAARRRCNAEEESLEPQIRALHSQLREREQGVNKDEELLAHDKDIRDLMGARGLYIAEVYDVGRDGATQKTPWLGVLHQG